MASSSKDDNLCNDIRWNYRAETAENCLPGDRKQPPISSGVLIDNSVYTNANYNSDVYLNKYFNVQTGGSATNNDKKVSCNNWPHTSRPNYGNAILNLGNGQLVSVIYDENNQQLIFPMNGQYELFNPNQGLRDMALQTCHPSQMFTLNQAYTMSNGVIQSPTSVQTNYNQDNNQNVPTSIVFKEVLGNWEPNSTGTYSPFSQNYPLNHPDTPTIKMRNTSVIEAIKAAELENSPKRKENSPLADTSNKKSIVAKVKPMRPTYSDVLTKNTKNNAQTEATHRNKLQNVKVNPTNNKNSKPNKASANVKQDGNNEKKDKKSYTNAISSGSESADITTEGIDKYHKSNKKSKNKKGNISRKWSSLDNITNEEDSGYCNNNSQFVFIENGSEKPLKKEKADLKNISKDKPDLENDFNLNDGRAQLQFVCQEGQAETKSRKKKDRNYHKVSKPSQDKKKCAQIKLRRNKPGYLGLAQGYLEHWMGVTWKAIIWFMYLLSDICHMSTHLTFDL